MTCLAACLATMMWPVSARAAEAVVAVAANFVPTLETLAETFQRDSGHQLLLVSGATGGLYSQIRQGAPYDVLLAADQRRPLRLLSDGLAVEGSRFTYAEGRLVLWRSDEAQIGAEPGIAATLAAGQFRRLAMANPALAPYGVAAQEVLQHLGLAEQLKPRIVLGQNEAQAFAMAATGNAELCLVALASVARVPPNKPGRFTLVPVSWHQPILQDAVLLKRARDNTAARAFLSWMQQRTARTLIAQAGYGNQALDQENSPAEVVPSPGQR